jgi:glyoxylase-like metal-dependent hydrolase (beta-lactamase superfamily II)
MRLALLRTTAASAVLLAACAPEAAAPVEAAETDVAEVADAPALTVNVLDCGKITISDLDAFSSAGDYAGQADEFTDTCYLINPPNGRLLWDLGLPTQLVGQPPFTQQIFTVSVEKSITDQLAALGVAASELTYMSISHSHFDHIGQQARQASAELILQKIREKNVEGYPVALLGDFNAGPDSGPILMLSTELRDARILSQTPPFGPQGTFNGFRFHEPVALRIDFIFVSPDVTVQQYAVLSDSKDCHYPSDHLPVLARIFFGVSDR